MTEISIPSDLLPADGRFGCGPSKVRSEQLDFLGSLQPHAPVPDLVIYLQAPPEALIERVRSRGNPIEAPITGDYLRALAGAYSEFFHHYDASPLLIVNTANLDPAHSDEDLAILLRQVQGMRGRREFFGRG